MKVSAKNAARPWGFTLIELLTVVAIIGVLATLLMAAVSGAKRKARQTVSISNLRQISLALNLYQDDHRKRPPTYAAMVGEKYIATNALVCAEDKMTGNWAGLIEDSSSASYFRPPTSAVAGRPALPPELPHSYFKAFDSSDEVWERIEKDPLAGIAACQLHGIGRQSADTPPALSAYQGLTLRALKDMSVVKRQVFWDSSGEKNADSAGSSFAPSGPASAPVSDLSLFMDQP